MTLQIKVKLNRPGVLRELASLRISSVRKITRATHEAVQQTRGNIKSKGDRVIRQSGNFGQRWLEGFRVEPTFLTGLLTARLLIYHTIPYASVFEYGATIQGKPLLWIPLSYTGIKMRARDYARRIGPLVRVTRKRDGLPLLISTRTKRPIYFGKSSVKIPKKWDITGIVNDAVATFPALFEKILGSAK